jgi:hypothetical protein
MPSSFENEQLLEGSTQYDPPWRAITPKVAAERRQRIANLLIRRLFA